MKYKDAFSYYHPALNFLYFTLVLLLGMFWMHPVCLAISLLSGFCYSLRLRGKKALHLLLFLILPMMLLAIIVNVAFNHEGATILTYLPSGNPLTAESVCYGAAAAGMLAGILLWFSCFHEVMTSDKFIYLFGRVIPALSLVLSMVLRFVPLLMAQVKTVIAAQRGIGRCVDGTPVFVRIRHGVRVLSIVLTWSLENAVETADSMKSRGYGLSGRTAFSVYRFDDRDQRFLVWLSFCGLYLIGGWGLGAMNFYYYPVVQFPTMPAFSYSFFCVYFALCMTPVYLDYKEAAKWKRS